MSSLPKRFPYPPVEAMRIEQAAAVLRRGGLVAVPTETVYGLGADATNPQAVERIFAAKGRPSGHPLIVHLASDADWSLWGSHIPECARQLAAAFWPGPLTLVVLKSTLVPTEVTGGLETVGLRVPDHPHAQALLQALGRGIAAPSANRFGRVSPTSPEHVRAELGNSVDLIIDGGTCSVGVESTIVDCTTEPATLLRPGAITPAMLEHVLQAPLEQHRLGPARAPGMLESHYAPQARVEVLESDQLAARCQLALQDELRVGVLTPQAVPGLPRGVKRLAPAGDPTSYARVLYSRLREADALGLHVLLVVPPPAEGVGLAVRDRLRRAAAAG